MELEDVYPTLHAMLHVAPLAKVPLQVPVPPFAAEKLAGMVQLAEVLELVLELVVELVVEFVLELELELIHVVSLPYNLPR